VMVCTPTFNSEATALKRFDFSSDIIYLLPALFIL
jgi:hypothetical protein